MTKLVYEGAVYVLAYGFSHPCLQLYLQSCLINVLLGADYMLAWMTWDWAQLAWTIE